MIPLPQVSARHADLRAAGLASSLTGIPLLGALLGMGALALCLAESVPLLLGALIGGLVA